MKILYNTTDHLYTGEDMKQALSHGVNLGRSDWNGDVDAAYREFSVEYVANATRDITMDDIMSAVAYVIGTSTYALTSIQTYGRGGKIPTARMWVSWFAYMYSDETLYEIADVLGYENHSSVIYGANSINHRLETYKGDRTTARLIKARLLHDGCRLDFVERKGGGSARAYGHVKTEIIE